ncbi:uncharacterized protein LOC120434372 [Oreochromis aureus]|uniref:uncharacterized protein LOC120434372 n=1 Tax=Oreochromis aureus TaxID=47969 RepID=UPI001952DADB|nr:uncharacterized protein LOC120434372 [Oreochromis aureus]
MGLHFPLSPFTPHKWLLLLAEAFNTTSGPVLLVEAIYITRGLVQRLNIAGHFPGHWLDVITVIGSLLNNVATTAAFRSGAALLLDDLKMCIKYFAFALLWFPGVLHAQSTTQACDAPTLDSGFFAPKQETYSHGTKLSYTCNEGLVQVKYQCNCYYKLTGAETVNFYSDGNWCELPTCEEAFCVVDPARYARYGLVKASSEYMREGETKPFPCTTKVYYINVWCTNRRIFLSTCHILRRPHVTAMQQRLSQFIGSSESGRQMRPSFPRI